MGFPLRSFNKVILVGRSGKEPEVTVRPETSRKLAKFTIATSETYLDQSKNRQEKTDWHNVIAWGPVADSVERVVHKGDLVLVEGHLRNRKWNDRNSGQERTVTEVEASSITILQRANRDGQGSSAGGGEYPYAKPGGKGRPGGGGESGEADVDFPPPADAVDIDNPGEDPF